jgi:hypothetical protein
MNLQLLIDSIVRQTTILVAQLATTGGVRAPLATVANQVFLDLADELAQQGVSRTISADMFGLALRTYLRKVKRLRESSTDAGRSLWEAVLDYLGEGRLVTRAEVLQRFHRDDAEAVRSVLRDLSESGLVLRLGTGPSTAYRGATKDELDALANSREADGTDELVWAIVFREGPIAHDALAKRLRRGDLDGVLSRLMAAGRVRRVGDEKAAEFCADHFVVPEGAAVGWEAAVFDHFQAVVKTICGRLRGEGEGPRGASVGGSTYSFDVWSGHPMEGEILGLLAELRQRVGEIRTRLRAYNAQHARPRSYAHVTVYCGESVVVEDTDSEV